MKFLFLHFCILDHPHHPITSTAAAPNMALLGLPAELRNQIWSYALVEDEAIKIPDDLMPVQIPLHPGLLSINRQIRAESTPIYYSENTFRLILGQQSSPYAMRGVQRSWFTAIGAHRAQHIRKIVVSFRVFAASNIGAARVLPDYESYVANITRSVRGDIARKLRNEDLVQYFKASGVSLEVFIVAPSRGRSTYNDAWQQIFAEEFDKVF